MKTFLANPVKILKKLRERTINRSQKIAWRLTTGWSGETVPVFIFGSQRSGTTMLGDCLGRSPQIENLGENDQRAFQYNSLRGIKTIDRLIQKSPYRHIVFKPLKDSHRALELLQLRVDSRAIWLFRNYADRVNSAVKLFGRHPLDVFQNYKNTGTVSWQLQCLEREDGDLIRGMNLDSLTEYDGAALMWYVRNKLFFNLNLCANPSVYLLSYEAFVSKPLDEMRSLTEFLGSDFSAKMVEGVHGESLRKSEPPNIRPDIEKLCTDLYKRLEATPRQT
jgi:hypothetical protein